LASYALVFSFRDRIAGEGFLAGVSMNGCALVEKENGAWWLYGVAPGGLAERGDELYAAHASFRESYRKVLFDLAAEAKSYEEFKAAVEAFCRVDTAEEARWHEAAHAIRSGKVTPEAPFSDLPRVEAASCKRGVTVERLDSPQRAFSTKDNELDQLAITFAPAA